MATIKQLPLYAEYGLLKENNTEKIKAYIDNCQFDNYAQEALIKVGNMEVINYFLSKDTLSFAPAFEYILNLDQDKGVINMLLRTAIKEKNKHIVPDTVRAYMQKELQDKHDYLYGEGVDYGKIEAIKQMFPSNTPKDEHEYLLPPYNSNRQEQLSIEHENRRV